MPDSNGSIVKAMLVMFLLSVVLFWLPVIGPIVAGFAGGRIAGNVPNSILAAILPAILFGVALFLLTGVLTGLPLIGAIAGMGATVLSLVEVAPLLLGAIIGGALA